MSRRTFLKRATIAMASLVPLTAGYSYGIEPRWIEIETQKIAIARLPTAFEGMRIAVFGDLHFGFHMDEEDLVPAIDKVMEQQPDLILFTGDLVDNDQFEIEKVISHLIRLQAPFGKFAVLGNHDYNGDQVAPTLQKAGFQVLRNAHALIRKEQETLIIVGVEDLLMGKPDLDRALTGALDTCRILLSHCPDFANQIIGQQVDLQVSGHSHGGQIRLPLIGALITPPGGNQYIDGYYRLAQTQVYVNRGIGTTILPFRFDCRPQISILQLSKA